LTYLLLHLHSRFFLSNNTPPSHIYSLSLHDALPIFATVNSLHARSGTGEIFWFICRRGIAAFCDVAIPCSICKMGKTFSMLRLRDRKSTRLNSSHRTISYAVFCLKKKKIQKNQHLSK